MESFLKHIFLFHANQFCFWSKGDTFFLWILVKDWIFNLKIFLLESWTFCTYPKVKKVSQSKEIKICIFHDLFLGIQNKLFHIRCLSEAISWMTLVDIFKDLIKITEVEWFYCFAHRPQIVQLNLSVVMFSGHFTKMLKLKYSHFKNDANNSNYMVMHKTHPAAHKKQQGSLSGCL